MEAAAARVLAARAQYPGATLALLYDPLTMPPPLAQAHAQLDRAVDACYRPASSGWRGALPRADYWRASGPQSLNEWIKHRSGVRASGPLVVGTGQRPAPSVLTAPGPTPGRRGSGRAPENRWRQRWETIFAGKVAFRR